MSQVPESTNMEEELDVVSSCELLEDMEEGEIQDDTLEELVASQVESTIEQTKEDETAGQQKKMKTSQEEQKNDNLRAFASDGTLPKKEERRLVKLKHGKQRDLRLPLAAQFALNTSPDRIHWLRQLFDFMNKIGSPILWSPSEPQLVCPGPALRISFDDISLCNYRVIFKISLEYRYRIFWKISHDINNAVCTVNCLQFASRIKIT